MRNCIGLADLLCAYADGELPESNKQLVEDHLAICENCSAVLKVYKEINVAVNDTNVQAPAALSIGVMNRIQSENTPRKATITKQKMQYKKILTRYAPIAAGLMVMLLVWQFWGDTFTGQNNSTGAGMPSAADAAPAPQAAMSAIPEAEAEMNEIMNDSDDGGSSPAGAPTAGGGAGAEQAEDESNIRSIYGTEFQDAESSQWFYNIDGFELVDEVTRLYINSASAVVSVIGDMPVFLINFQPLEKTSWEEWWIQSGWDELYEIPSSEISILLNELNNRDGVETAHNTANPGSEFALVVYSRGA